MPPTETPILFHYPPSIYSHRVLWYLWLRNIPYNESIQPPVMPRPDLASIDVGYRKIPLMSIGKDVYCDSRLIIQKLEAFYPGSELAPSTPSEEGVRRLFENYSIDGGVFGNAVKLMPYWTDTGLLQNKVFLDDRQKLMGGRRMTAEMMGAGRPDGLQAFRQVFELLETTFLADGRDWILGGKGPSTADIDAVWPLEWVMCDRNMKGALEGGNCGEDVYPKVHKWVRMFMDLVERKKEACRKPESLNEDALTTRVMNAWSPTDDIGFSTDDPLRLQLNDQVEAYPSDYGQSGRCTGSLVGLSTTEVVLRNSKGLHIHLPRWNFAIRKVTPSSSVPVTPSIKKIPKMRLIYHPFSPYTRKVFMLAHELNLAQHIELQKVAVCPVPIEGWSVNNKEVSVYNPLTKIPCLISEDVPDGIYDSNIICEYLEDLAGVTRKKDTSYWRLHTLHACADGLMDAAVLIAYEVQIRKERGLYFEEWMDGQKQKILRGLDRLEGAVKEKLVPEPGTAPASSDEVAIATAVAMTSQMSYLDIDYELERPDLKKWLVGWEKRASFIATPPRKDWTVDGKMPGAAKI